MRRPTEDGFVLIAALWLLLLCAAVVAVMLARNSARAQDNRDQRVEFQQQLELEAAVETVAADLAIKGGASSWALLPVEQPLSINGHEIQISVSSDAGRLDLNSGDAAMIDRALQGLGVGPAERSTFKAALEERRREDKSFPHMIDAVPTLALLSSLPCPTRWFTVYSGLSQPDEAQLDSELARALGIARSGAFGRQPLKPGVALRVKALHPDGMMVQATVRLSGLGRPYETLQWERASGC